MYFNSSLWSWMSSGTIIKSERQCRTIGEAGLFTRLSHTCQETLWARQTPFRAAAAAAMRIGLSGQSVVGGLPPTARLRAGSRLGDTDDRLGDALAGVARGLGLQVVRVRVDDQAAADDRIGAFERELLVHGVEHGVAVLVRD
jgi:hypothetical protein